MQREQSRRISTGPSPRQMREKMGRHWGEKEFVCQTYREGNAKMFSFINFFREGNAKMFSFVKPHSKEMRKCFHSLNRS
jgi:hypothetical protein